MIPSSSETNELRTRCIVARTSWWSMGSGSTPAAAFEMHEMPSTSRPMWRAAIASGTVDIPIASAPMVR